MYRVHLSDEQRQELQRRAHAPEVAPRTRDRLEMVRLSDFGFSIPWIACHLRQSEGRVRHRIKQFLAEGFDALPDQPHPGQQSAVTPAMLAALQAAMADSPQAWTARQIADWSPVDTAAPKPGAAIRPLGSHAATPVPSRHRQPSADESHRRR